MTTLRLLSHVTCGLLQVMMEEGALAGIEAITQIHVGNDGFRLEAGEIATRVSCSCPEP